MLRSLIAWKYRRGAMPYLPLCREQNSWHAADCTFRWWRYHVSALSWSAQQDHTMLELKAQRPTHKDLKPDKRPRITRTRKIQSPRLLYRIKIPCNMEEAAGSSKGLHGSGLGRKTKLFRSKNGRASKGLFFQKQKHANPRGSERDTGKWLHTNESMHYTRSGSS